MFGSIIRAESARETSKNRVRSLVHAAHIALLFNPPSGFFALTVIDSCDTQFGQRRAAHRKQSIDQREEEASKRNYECKFHVDSFGQKYQKS